MTKYAVFTDKRLPSRTYRVGQIQKATVIVDAIAKDVVKEKLAMLLLKKKNEAISLIENLNAKEQVRHAVNKVKKEQES